MGLSALEVESYRSFGLPARLTLRPLTLVFGHNSRGKSALVRALPLLGASADRKSPGPLNTRSQAVRGATFAEIKAKHHLSATMGFQLEWADTLVPVLRLGIRILGGGARGLEYVEQLEAFDARGARRLKLLLKDDARSFYDVHGPEITDALTDVQVDFQGLIPRIKGLDASSAIAGALESVRNRLEDLHDHTYWLEAVRALPERNPELRGKPSPIEPDGRNAAEHLAFSRAGDHALLDEVAAFYRNATGHDLFVDLVTVGGVARFSVTLSPLAGPAVRVNILDTGEGMAQVLPIVVLGAMAKLGQLGQSPVVVLEHPELHLHPRAHGDVAKFLCGVATACPEARIVVETHSENFLSEVQLAVLRGALAPDQVALNWVWAHEEGSAVQLLEMDALARIEAWPPGVFSEDSDLKRRILVERRKRMEREGHSEAQ